MTTIVTGVFLILHGLVHLLYLGQSARRFELQPGLTWPDGSWVFARLLGVNGTRTLASAACLLAAAGFTLAGAGVFFGQGWWQAITVATAAFSALLYLLFWDGRLRRLDAQGALGIIIDIAILAAVLLFGWPSFDF